MPAAVEVAAYRITAEALNNVLRHARARHARVALRVDEAHLVLTVQDDGIGLGEPEGPDEYLGADDPGPADGDPADGVGLRSMSDRAAEIGGRCTVGRLARTNGTRVLAVLPRHPSRSPRPGA